MAKTHLLNKQKELGDYKSETLKVIRGESRMSVDKLGGSVRQKLFRGKENDCVAVYQGGPRRQGLQYRSRLQRLL